MEEILPDQSPFRRTHRPSVGSSHPRLLCVHGILAENGEGAWPLRGVYRQVRTVEQNLNGPSISVKTPLGKRYPGVHPKNICNRGAVEKDCRPNSPELRKQLLSNPDFLEAFSRKIADTLKSGLIFSLKFFEWL